MKNSNTTPVKKISASVVIAVVLLVAALGLIGTSVYRHFNPDQIAIPTLEETYTVSADDPAVRQRESIPGANSGANPRSGQGQPGDTSEEADSQNSQDPEGEGTPSGNESGQEEGDSAQGGLGQMPSSLNLGYDLADGYTISGVDPQTGVTQVSGPEVDVPGIGDYEAGEEGVLTDGGEAPVKRSSGGDPISKELAAACPKMTSGSMCIPAIDEVIYWHSVGTRNSTTNGNLVMAVPSTDTAGWLDDSAPLGAREGTSVFAAHVVFKGGVPGPFYELNKLKPGDEIIMRDMNGKNYTYRVYASEVTEGKTLPDEVYQYSGVPHRIALVTCTGTFIEGHYDRRMILWAAPVS